MFFVKKNYLMLTLVSSVLYSGGLVAATWQNAEQARQNW